MSTSLPRAHCHDTGAQVMPVIDLNRCGGKEDCVMVCPFNVLEMRDIADADRDQLNLKGKIKTFFFKQKAYVRDPNLCHGCGLCVQVCPEKAIKLTRRTP